MSTISKIAEKLRDPEYRKAFVASQINIGIPFQLRAMLRNRPGWTQTTLAQQTGMLQPRISGLMTPGKVRPNIETLRRIAEAFDCALLVKFVPFSELAKWSADFDPDTFSVPAFGEDSGFPETTSIQSALAAGAANSAAISPPADTELAGVARGASDSARTDPTVMRMPPMPSYLLGAPCEGGAYQSAYARRA